MELDQNANCEFLAQGHQDLTDREAGRATGVHLQTGSGRGPAGEIYKVRGWFHFSYEM